MRPAAGAGPQDPAGTNRPVLAKLKFSGKIVTRNLFRNKARLPWGFWASSLGCPDPVRFGQTDSINAMLGRAFDERCNNNVEIKLKTPLTIAQLSDIYDRLDGARQHRRDNASAFIFMVRAAACKALIWL
jgi:putative ABC transport system permease protein